MHVCKSDTLDPWWTCDACILKLDEPQEVAIKRT